MSEPYFVFVAHDMRNGELFISKKGPASLPDTWLLIDSCSTVDIISSPDLLHGIHKVSNPIRVRCNVGVTILDQMGYLGDYPRPVWYNPDSGANIMSMFNISQQYHLSMNMHKANAGMLPYLLHLQMVYTNMHYPTMNQSLGFGHVYKPWKSIRITIHSMRSRLLTKHDNSRTLL